jgi:MFS family permease
MSALFLELLAVAGMEIGVTLHARDRFHFTQLDLAYFFLFMGLIVAVIQGGLIGRIVRRIGEPLVVITGASAFMLGFVLVPSVFRVPLLYVVAFLVGIGQGLCYPALTSMVSKVAPEADRGSILGLATSIGSLARFRGPILSGFLYDFGKAAGAFYGGAIIMAAALAISVRMRAAAEQR